MDATRILVIGAGSIGARHARTLRALGARVDLADPDAARAAGIADDNSGVRAVPFALDALAAYDGVVVASPTVHHADQTRAALVAGARVLVEKPLGLRATGLDDLGSDRVMVGYNLRFHEPVVRLMELVHSGRVGRVWSVRAWFGSWLPDWRPAVDYRETYSAQAALGGGVLLDAIHELDLLVWLLGDGDFDVVGAVVARLGPLDIDVEDTVHALLRHRSGVVADVSLDYLSRRYRRGIEVVGEDATIRLDWADHTIAIDDRDSVAVSAADTPVDRSYEREAEAFLAFVRDGVAPPVDGTGGLASLRLADAIRTAAR